MTRRAAAMVTLLRNTDSSSAPSRLRQKENRRGSTEHFGYALTKTAPQSQSKCAAIKRDRFLKIIDINVG